MREIMEEKDSIIEDLQNELRLKNESLYSIIDYNHTLRGHNEILDNRLEYVEEELFKRTHRLQILDARQRVLRRFLKERCDMKIEDIDEFITQIKYEAASAKRKKKNG
jgi:hypothetical protein